MSNEPLCVLLGAKDTQGRLWLVDARVRLPVDAQEVEEFTLTSDQIEWAMLRVQVEEIRGVSVTIHIGDYQYTTPPPLRWFGASPAKHTM